MSSCLPVYERDVYSINVSATSLDSSTYCAPTRNTGRYHFCELSATLTHSRVLSLSCACANARSHRHIELDYNVICCGRDGMEQQIMANEENQSPWVQISWKLVRSDWFWHGRRLGGIWQITVSQVDSGKGCRVKGRGKWLDREKNKWGEDERDTVAS